MSRGLSAAFLTALSDKVLRPVLLFEGAFASGTLRLWTGLGDVTWNGQVWTGAGNLMGVSSVEETTKVVASGFSVSLSGVPATYVAMCLNDARQGLSGKLWLGLLDSSGAVIAEPSLAQAGRLNVPTITDDADTCTITISYESRLIDLQRARDFRYTDESQKLLKPGDRAFEYVTAIQGTDVTWGR